MGHKFPCSKYHNISGLKTFPVASLATSVIAIRFLIHTPIHVKKYTSMEMVYCILFSAISKKSNKRNNY